MSAFTTIAWTDRSWNPWHGCKKVSPGCAHCYMFRDKKRYGQNPNIVQRSKTTFNDPLKWKEPALVFTCSWSDWFHEAADAWRDEAWDIIRRSPHLTFQILTKRPERMAAHMPKDWGDGYPNVWLGVSVENQRWVSRIPHLLNIPAAQHFLSCEPLLGPIDLKPILYGYEPSWHEFPDGISWVIVGGESGPDARPMELDWARTIRDHCVDAGVSFFLKQLGGHPDARAHDKAVLDGRTYTEFPGVR